MKKHIPFLFLVWAVVLSAKATNINKPVAAQYGFIQNKGQIIDQNNQPNPSVLYLYNGNGLRVQLRKGGFSYEVIHTVKTPKAIINEEPTGKFASETDSFDISHEVHRVDINFKEGNKNAVLKPYDAASDYINYYTTATPEQGITQVQHFHKVIYENVYPNIDIEFILNDASNKGKFKYNFIVKPHANLADLQLELVGANRTSLNKAGNILIETAYGNIEENIPLSYVINDNNSHSSIKANFIALNNNTYGINAADYNHNQTLVIDPTNWATYYGGNDGAVGYGIATDTSGNILVTGIAGSSNAIATVGAYQTIMGGSWDAFIAKFNDNGIRQWATYYGGSDGDEGNGIVTDASGNSIITGKTKSTNAIAAIGAHQTTYGGSFCDAFIAKFNSNGIRQWGTYYGGSGAEYGNGIATDANGNIVITGYTTSSNAISTVGVHQTISGGNGDAFIAKFNSNGVRQWATYYGGPVLDFGNGIATDASGNIIITGRTNSTNGIATVGAHQTAFGGSTDAFIVKFDSSGIRYWATYYGGNSPDEGNEIATDVGGNIIAIGFTSTTNGMATVGAHQTICGGNYDAFIAKFNTSGVRQWATYFGESGADYGNEVATDINGDIIITGSTYSSNAIATIGAQQTVFGGGTDAFIAKFNDNGIRQWATYLGGSNEDEGYGIVTDANGNIIITGKTSSTNAIATIGAHQIILGGSADAFIAKFSAGGLLPVKLLSFAGKKDGESVLLTWQTASEVNNAKFEIQRSNNNTDWIKVGNVKGNGTTNLTSRYQFIDNNINTAMKEPSLYYRLKQMDFDGAYEYSKSILIQEETIELVQLTPNPFSNEILLTPNKTTGEMKIEIINAIGSVCYTGSIHSSLGQITIPTAHLKLGVYLIKIQSNSIVQIYKMLKQ